MQEYRVIITDHHGHPAQRSVYFANDELAVSACRRLLDQCCSVEVREGVRRVAKLMCLEPVKGPGVFAPPPKADAAVAVAAPQEFLYTGS